MAKSKTDVAGANKPKKVPPLRSPLKGARNQKTKPRIIEPTALRSLTSLMDSLSTPTASNPPTNKQTIKEPPTHPQTSIQPPANPPTTKQPPANPPTTKQPPANPPTTKQPPTNPPTTKQPPANPPTTKQPSTNHPTTKQPTINPNTTIQPPSNPETTSQPLTTSHNTINPTRRPTKQQKSQAIREFFLRRSPRKHSIANNQLPKNPPPKVVDPPANQTTDDYISTDDGLRTDDMDMCTVQRRPLSLVDEEDSDDSVGAIPDRFNDNATEGETHEGAAVGGEEEGNDGAADRCEQGYEGADDGCEGGDEGVDGGPETVDQGMNEGVEQYTSSDKEDGAAETSTGKKGRRTRGPTRCLRQHKHGRVTVILNNFGQPIGPMPYISQLGSSIGILAKNHLVVSLEYKSWREVPEPVKTEMWRLLKKNWRIPSRGKDWVLKTAGACWRSYKSRLKAKFYMEGMTRDELLKRRPVKLIPLEQWEKIVDYWLDDKTKELSIRNRNSVKKRKNVHTAGSRSFARIVAAEAKDGKEPSLAAMYIKTHTSTKGKNLVDDQTQAELQQLGDDNDAVEEYLLKKELIKHRPGSIALRGRGVSHRVFKKAKFEEKVNKKAEDKVERVRSECRAQMNELRDQFTTVIINLLGKLKATNVPSDYEGFNPFEGLSLFANDSTNNVSEDESYSNDDNVGAAEEGSGSDDEEYSGSGEEELNEE